MSTWTGKVGVVTGGANGIGLGIAQRFYNEGMRVVIADFDEESLEKTVASFGGDESRVIGVQIDAAVLEDIERLEARSREHFGQVHVLVSNAGVNAYGFTAWETPQATWDWVLGVNLFGPVNGVRVFLPKMLEAGEGHIISTASGAALASAPLRSAYSASKHALLAYKEALFYELLERESPVRVSILIPGRVMTTIRDSKNRWPERLGANSALGPEGTNFSVPMTPELGALDISVPANEVWDAMQTGKFLIDVGTGGLNSIANRIRELSGINPVLPKPPGTIERKKS